MLTYTFRCYTQGYTYIYYISYNLFGNKKRILDRYNISVGLKKFRKGWTISVLQIPVWAANLCFTICMAKP
jgi:hypothetical protein